MVEQQKLIQVTPARLMIDHIEHRFGAEPARSGSADGLVGVGGFGLSYLDRLGPGPTGGGVGHELGVAASFQRDEPENGGLNRRSYRQEPVILQQGRFFVAKAGGNILALFLGEDNPVERFVQDVVLGPGANVSAETCAIPPLPRAQPGASAPDRRSRHLA